MCIAIPGRVTALEENGKIAVIDYGSEKRKADNSLASAKIGDWVLVQSKMVVAKLSEEDAKASISAWKQASIETH